MGKWQEMSLEAKWTILEELVKKIADQMAAVIDAGNHSHINDSIVVSSGDLSEQVSMFRLDDRGVGVFEVGVLAKRSGMEPNIVIGIRIASDSALGDFVLVVRGVIVDDYGTGYFVPLEKGEDSILRRTRELLKMDKEQDIGRVEQELIHPFLKGRWEEDAPAQQPNHFRHKHPKRKLISNEPGSFWIEVRK